MSNKHLSKEEIKTLSLSSLGGTLEFYDFIIFVFFVKYISVQFFPKELSEFWQLLNTYGAFAAGYLVRPLGGIVMAHFGDKFGRKNMFMLSILLMVIPTFALAFIPGFATIGYAAPVLLILVRIFQGIAIGGELPGAWVFVREHSPEESKGKYLGILTSAVVGGILLGSIMALVINKTYTDAEIMEWAWRIPFFVGGIFGILSIYLRRYLHETPVFKKMKEEQELSNFPLKEVFRHPMAKYSITVSMLMTWVLTGCIVVMVLMMPNFMPALLGISKITNIYLQMTGIAMICVGCIVGGMLADKFRISTIAMIFATMFGVFSFLYFHNLYSKSSFEVVAPLYLLTCFGAGVLSFCPLMMTEVFEARIRFSGLSFSYNLAYAIAGGFTPQLVLFLHATASKAPMGTLPMYGIAFYILALSFVALLASSIFRVKFKA